MSCYCWSQVFVTNFERIEQCTSKVVMVPSSSKIVSNIGFRYEANLSELNNCNIVLQAKF